jgi:ketosteroid isomerase-like protein
VLSVAAVLALLFVIWSYLANRTFFVAVRTEVALADSGRVVAPLLDFESPSSDKKPDPPVQDPNQHQEAGVSVNDLKALMGHFMETYNRGDLAGFMTLFDERARTSSHYGKPAIRKHYKDFFSITASRRLILNGLQWHREGVIASGRGGFQVRVRMRDGRTVHDSRGTIRFEVRKRRGAVKIQVVYHEMN